MFRSSKLHSLSTIIVLLRTAHTQSITLDDRRVIFLAIDQISEMIVISSAHNNLTIS